MAKKMLIDAAHPEETRVAIIDENKRLIDYDFESATKKTLKGNIYLAKVARVEPSLQAAFIDYGAERHGFLAFNEIHPDYFRIPISDRQALEKKLNEEVEQLREQENAKIALEEEKKEATTDGETEVSTIGGELDVSDADDQEEEHYRPSLHRLYKIQEVIKKNQILLVQVTKEERGGKGAALTTYISMAGRYCVLMPNSPRSGGISRKISNITDRKRLRSILDSLETPEGMGLIIRTAGMERTKVEIKRDAEYLMRQWNSIRKSTLESIAPSLIYQEDDITKRAIRDLYTKDIAEVLVEGEEGHRIAKAFMKSLMPSHMKRVKLYSSDGVPLFYHAKIEKQIDEMHSPMVRLPSGGSIVIHPTEALVSIDINSGRATKERHIEETAYKTNLEAAEEIYRQVRLRDLAGLIVIDFIDMDNNKNTANVERRVREIFRNDRARVQIGKISPFGLLELSRQRLKPSILETASVPCSHCQATGFIRSTESVAIMIIRILEEEGFAKKAKKILLKVPEAVAFYILNNKRLQLSSMEKRHGFTVVIESDPKIITPNYTITRLEEVETKKPQVSEEPREQKEAQEEAPTPQHLHQQKKGGGRNRHRRRSKHQHHNQNFNQPHHGEDAHQSSEPNGNIKPPVQNEVHTDEMPMKKQDESSQSEGTTTGSGGSSGGHRHRHRHRHFRHRHKNRPHNPQQGDEKTQGSSQSEGASPSPAHEHTQTPAQKLKENIPVSDTASHEGPESTTKGKGKGRKSWLKRLIKKTDETN